MKKDNILKKLVSDGQSNWKIKAEFRKNNKHWLDKSAIIALKILEHIRKNNISQKELAELIDVSPQYINKILKGSENLTLQTITNIEYTLGISLIEVSVYTNSYDDLNIKKRIINKEKKPVRVKSKVIA